MNRKKSRSLVIFKIFSQVCTCLSGFTGSDCELPIPCDSKPCDAGTCLNDADFLGYTCDCTGTERFGIPLGSDCNLPTPCYNTGGYTKCQNGGTCQNYADFSDYVCDCPAGFTGKTCNIAIPCDANPCQNGGSCENHGDYSGYFCTCESGFTGNNCQTAVPCASDPCQNGGVCTDLVDYAEN